MGEQYDLLVKAQTEGSEALERMNAQVAQLTSTSVQGSEAMRKMDELRARVRGALVQVEENLLHATRASNEAQSRAAVESQRLMQFTPGRFRTATVAAADLVNTLANVGRGSRSAFESVSMLSTQIALSARTASLAAGATGIGALAMAIGTLASLYQNARKPQQQFFDDLKSMDLGTVRLELARITRELEALTTARLKNAEVSRQIGIANPGREFAGLTAAASQGKSAAELRLEKEKEESSNRMWELSVQRASREAQNIAAQHRALQDFIGVQRTTLANETEILNLRRTGATERQISEAEIQNTYEKQLALIKEQFTIRNSVGDVIEVQNPKERQALENQELQLRNLRLAEAAEVERRADLVRERARDEARDRRLAKEKLFFDQLIAMAKSRRDEMLSLQERAARTEDEILAVTFARIEAELSDKLKLPEFQNDAAALRADAELQKGQAVRDMEDRRAQIARDIQSRAGPAGEAQSEVERIRAEGELLLEFYKNNADMRVKIEEDTAAQIRDVQSRAFMNQMAQLQFQFSAMSNATRGRWKALHEGTKNAADAIGRVLMAAEAVHAAQMAKKEFAAMLGDFAKGNIAGGALHAASAANYVAAAAMGGIGAVVGTGGGGGGGGGNGFSGGTSDPFNFSPRSADNQPQSIVINLITKDPYGSDQINQTIYQINRAGILNRPIPVYPTTGIEPA